MSDRPDWYCPVCATRLSYGIYCKTCGEERMFAMRPATPEQEAAWRSRLTAEEAVADQIILALEDLDRDSPGTIRAAQQHGILAHLGKLTAAERHARLTELAGREVPSTNDLSFTEAAAVLAKLEGK